MELLWSDPTQNDEVLGLQPNTIRDPLKQNSISLFGPDVIEKFLKVN
jgi:protein phosphatase